MSDDCVCGHPKVRHDPPGGECYESGCKCRRFLNGGDYTPTSEEVRDSYARVFGPGPEAKRRAEFNRWLVANDAEVRADQQEKDAQIVDLAVRTLQDAVEPLHTIVADGAAHALITRHNGVKGGDPARMTTPADEYLRTLTTTAQQSIIRRPGNVTAKDLDAAMEMVPEVLFRMFQPHEVAAGMAFPADYKWQPPDRARPVSNRDLVKAAGNAVTPPAARDVVGAAVEAMEAA